MKLDDFYHLVNSDYCLPFIVIFTMFWLMRPSAFFRCFMSNSGAYTELQTEPFI